MTTKNFLIAAAISGALSASSAVALAGPMKSPADVSIERMGCKSKPGMGKDGCKGHDKQGTKKKKNKNKKQDKNACAGKDGCGGKQGKDKPS